MKLHLSEEDLKLIVSHGRVSKCDGDSGQKEQVPFLFYLMCLLLTPPKARGTFSCCITANST